MAGCGLPLPPISPGSAMKRTPLLLLAVLSVIGGRADAADAARGESLYETRCTGCHSLDSDRIGPRHRGVYGRRAGSIVQFDYSAAVKKSKIAWDDKSLDRWLADPEKLIPGQRMGYRVDNAADRADLIAFLRRESDK